MNNSLFGKTVENIRNRVDVRVRTSEKSAEKLVPKPNYERTTIFSEDLIAVHMKKTELVFNKPVYLGMSILDISKTRINDFHYNYMKVKYGDDCKLLITDTDSLMYEVKTEDFYKDIREDVQEILDTSNFPQNHSSGIPRMNKNVPGLFKDECGGEPISGFCALRAKLYAFKKDGQEQKRCKGVKKSVVSKSIHLEDYKRCLFTEKEEHRKMNVIRSREHELFTETVNKIALSANDDKRIIQPDKIQTLAHGHFRTQGHRTG